MNHKTTLILFTLLFSCVYFNEVYAESLRNAVKRLNSSMQEHMASAVTINEVALGAHLVLLIPAFLGTGYGVYKIGYGLYKLKCACLGDDEGIEEPSVRMGIRGLATIMIGASVLSLSLAIPANLVIHVLNDGYMCDLIDYKTSWF